jgi:hypothetical protein
MPTALVDLWVKSMVLPASPVRITGPCNHNISTDTSLAALKYFDAKGVETKYEEGRDLETLVA